MKIWARMLADLPPTLQRLIARSQRISLPRSCPAPERLRRLRAALCRQRTVRVTYFALAPNVQAAVQDLRTIPRGLSPTALTARYGPIRPWSQIQTDPRPQSISEHLVLLGWLVPRPATPRHPTRYLLPPELRAALPRPFTIATHGPAPRAPLPAAVRAATTILLTSAEAPLPIRQNGTVRAASLRRILPRLAPLPVAEAVTLCQFVTPLLGDLGLLAPHVGGTAVLSPAGQRFLAQSIPVQQERLRAAWVAAPRPDGWLRAVSRNRRGIDWPLFRRRLLIWAQTLPAQQLVDPADMYGALAQALGPLADAQTHGFRQVSRTPWQPEQQARIWQAALRGPLAWLGAIAWTTLEDGAQGRCFSVVADQMAGDGEETTPALSEPRWQAGPEGTVAIPHTANQRAVLALLPYTHWQRSDATHTTYQLTPQTLAAALRAGWALRTLRVLLQRQVGDLPMSWIALLDRSQPTIQIVQTAVVTSADPALLARATRQRTVRRYLTARLAPGVALVDPRRIGSLARTLERAALPVMVAGDPSVAPPMGLTPAECATLLAVCDGYRQQTREDERVPQLANVEARLRAALPATLRPTTDDTVELDQPAAAAAEPEPPRDAIQAPAPADAPVSYLPALRRAIGRRRAVQIRYTAREERHPTTRIIRPLALEQHGPQWYLHAYCTRAQAERCFRLDRISWLLPLMQRRPRGNRRAVPVVEPLPLTPLLKRRVAAPPQIRRPLVRVWLE